MHVSVRCYIIHVSLSRVPAWFGNSTLEDFIPFLTNIWIKKEICPFIECSCRPKCGVCLYIEHEYFPCQMSFTIPPMTNSLSKYKMAAYPTRLPRKAIR
jgi:hypothetical protein